MKTLHRHRKIFLLLNGLLIVGFSLSALLGREHFWPFLGIDPGSPYLDRTLAWYLFTLGLGGVLVARAPERQPLVVGLIGLEKVGAVVAFTLHLLNVRFNLPLAGVTALDAVLAVTLLGYSWWLIKEHPDHQANG